MVAARYACVVIASPFAMNYTIAQPKSFAIMGRVIFSYTSRGLQVDQAASVRATGCTRPLSMLAGKSESRPVCFMQGGESEVEPNRLVNDLGREPVSSVADLLHPAGYRVTRRTASPSRRDDAPQALGRFSPRLSPARAKLFCARAKELGRAFERRDNGRPSGGV